ncbi:MAG: tripartite tricarboxylate transporter TctB family protein [Peptococcales bacterium]|jgi:putative tricarboxylic transport membrane protein
MNIRDLKLSTFVSFLLIVFTSIYFINSFNYIYWQGYVPGAGFAPRWVSGLMLIVSIICLIQSFKEEGIKIFETFPKGDGLKNIIVTWVSLIFYVIFSPFIGFTISSVIILTALFGRSISWKKSLVLSIFVTLICFYVFKIVLKVSIPVNSLGW